MLQVSRLETGSPDFERRLADLLAFEDAQDESIERVVAAILADVKQRGDSAVLEYTRRFDRLDAGSWRRWSCRNADVQSALGRLPTRSAKRWSRRPDASASYHERQVSQSWSYTERDGTALGQQITRARPRRHLRSRRQGGVSFVGTDECDARARSRRARHRHGGAHTRRRAQRLVLAAAAICGVNRVFTIGGAQAVGALAYGTESVPPVDKIVGPGNAYVAAAKRRVFGVVGIDMVAGPSEILVICDGNTEPGLGGDGPFLAGRA